MIRTIASLQFRCLQTWQLVKGYNNFVSLVAIIFIAVLVRLTGFDWDHGLGFHPDERSIYMRSFCMYRDIVGQFLPAYCGSDSTLTSYNISQYFNPGLSPLNPHWFPLGTILIYGLVVVQFAIPIVDVMDLRYIGRILTLLAEIFSIIVYYKLASKMFGPKTGLITALLIGFSVSHIQHSLFYRPEPFMVLFCGLVLLGCWNRYIEHSWKTSALIGVTLGLAIAFKVSSALLVLPILAMFLGLWVRDYRLVFDRQFILLNLEGAGIALLAVVTFFVCSPFAFLDFEQFYSDIKIQSLMAGSAGMFPFTTQYFGTAFLAYNVRQIFYWGLGIPLGMVTLVMIGRGIWHLYVTRYVSFKFILLLSWVLPFFFFMESYEVKFIRYLYPIFPVLLIMNAYFIARIPKMITHCGINMLGRRFTTMFIAFGTGLVIVVISLHVIYGLGFIQIYRTDHTAVQASDWIKQSIAPGTRIITESHWDEQIPGLHDYRTWLYPAYEEDTIDKMYQLAMNLESSEYVVFYSNRPYVGITADQIRYPYSTAYYKALFNQDLGYELHRAFQEFPNLLGFHIKDDVFDKTGLNQPILLSQLDSEKFGLSVGYADENVINYDHPVVLLFKNEAHMSTESLLQTILDYESRNLYPYQLKNSDLNIAVIDNHSDTDGNSSNLVSVLKWLAILYLLSCAVIPITFLVCRFLPDRGYGLTKILGLFLVSYLYWILVSSSIMSNAALYCWITILLLASLNLIVLYRYHHEIKSYFLNNWKYVCTLECLFIISFLGFLILRLTNPDLWHPYRGGEKPMELAYLNAVIRSVSFPPYDPWMSGSIMNYYYWGYVPLAILTKITNLSTNTSFNLSVVTLFSVTSALLFSLGANMLLGVYSLKDKHIITANNLVKASICGLAAVVFVIVMGNMDGALQIWSLILNYIQLDVWLPFDYWRSSRVIPMLEPVIHTPWMFWISDQISQNQYLSPHITEFPFFTFLFADLHAHMISIPFSIMVLILGINAYISKDRTKRTFVAVALFAVGCGSLFAINAWDYPTYCVLGLLLLVGRLIHTGSTKDSYIETIWLGLMYVFIGYFSFWMFHLGFNSAEASLIPSIWATPITSFLVIKLFPLSCVTGLIVSCLLKDLYLLKQTKIIKFNALLILSFVVILIISVFCALIGWPLAGLLMLLIFGLLYCSKSLLTDPNIQLEKRWMVLPILLMGYSLLIDLGVEFLRYDNDIGRMNTLFKFYLQSWIISGVASVGLLILIGEILPRPRLRFFRYMIFSPVLVIAIFAMSYPFFAIHPRVNDRFIQTELTLDGLKYADSAIHAEKDKMFSLKSDGEMIDWLNASVKGNSVILEAVGDQYRWNARVSSYTGLSTVLGWPWHQTQQKPYIHSNIVNRTEDIRTIYQTDDLALKLKLIDKYNVEIIIWGELEEIYYSKKSKAHLDQLEVMGVLNKIYLRDKNTVYQVIDN